MKNNNIVINLFIVIFLSLMVFSCSATILSTKPNSISSPTNSGFISSTEISTPAYPLKVSTSNRYLVDQNNQPVFLSGDAAWSLIVQLTDYEVDTYLADRSSKGFNAVLVNLIEHQAATYAPNNIYNVAPFTSTVFTTPNEAYFAHADYVINKAAQYGINVFLAPLYLGWHLGSGGWGVDVQAASIEDIESWGTYVGNRYQDFNNIIWVIGGDSDPVAEGVGLKTEAFANALITADPNHLVTAHVAGEQLGTTPDWTDISWLTLNSAYTAPDINTAPSLIGSGYDYSPTLPVFNIEALYENEYDMTSQQLRSIAYWSILAGGCGYIFGNNPIWHFGFYGGDWQAALDSPGAFSMSYAALFFRSEDWYDLVPDVNHIVATAGYGTIGTNDYITTAWVEDGSLAISYFPSEMTLTIDLSKFRGLVNARWYDPTDGTFTTASGSPFSNIGTHDFTPIGNNAAGDGDWALIFESNSQASNKFFLPFVQLH